jgi:hypothetical protein
MAKTLPSFDVTAAESRIIFEIADRALRDLTIARLNDPFTKQDVAMDVTATHANGCPLRLEALLGADAFTFTHDILGIRRHLNRDTGALEDCFVPRVARTEV